MSAFRGKERNKGALRRNARAAEYFSRVIARQDKQLVEKLKQENGNKIITETEPTTSNL